MNQPPEHEVALAKALSRRRFLAAAGIGGAATAFLAACGSSSKGGAGATTTAGPTTTAGGATTTAGGATTTAGSPTTTANLKGTNVVFANWQSYMDDGQQTLKDFTAATGIKVDYREIINGNDDFLASQQQNLDAGKSLGLDIVTLTDWMAARWIRKGWVQPLTVPNVSNMQDQLLNVSWDPGRKYSMPWASGMTGIAYDPAKTGGDILTIEDMLSNPKLKGRIAMLTEARDSIGLVMLAQGADPATATTDQINAAIARIKKAKDSGQIRQFTGNDYTTGLTNGDLIACVAWSGDIYQLQKDKPGLKWVIPNDGGMLWSDNMMVTAKADNAPGAFQVMNWYYDPKVSAQLNASIHYISPVKGTQAEMEKIDPDSAKNPLVNPTDEMRAKLHIFKGLSDEEEKAMNDAFQPLVAG